MGRAPCCDKANVKKGPWSPEEDAKLKDYIDKFGTGGNWIALPQKVGLKRCGKSCRLRWLNYLRPNIKHGEFSDEEDRIICTLFANIGSRWSIIAAQLPGRTDNDIKNYWNTKLKKKLMSVVHNNNNPLYNNVIHHKKFIANNPSTFTQNPSSTSDLHESCTSSTNSSFSLSYQAPLLMPSSYYHTAPRSFSLGLEPQQTHDQHMSNNFPNPNSSSSYLNFSGVGHNSLQYYYPKDSINGATSNAFMFGSRSSEGSCSTSSDGSCNYQMMKQDQEMGFQYRHGSFMGMLNSSNIIDNDHNRYSNVNLTWGQTPLNDQDHHGVKQMMISDHASNDYVLFNVDENKTQENKVVYF